jgi:hypothetical protein
VNSAVCGAIRIENTTSAPTINAIAHPMKTTIAENVTPNDRCKAHLAFRSGMIHDAVLRREISP